MNSNDIKKISIFIIKNLKDKEIKQSALLEIMAKYNGYNDWNTLVGVENKSIIIEDNGWSNISYIHVDNGGYEFSYHKQKELLKIETGFFGYSSNTHIFAFTKKDIKSFLKCFKEWYKLVTDEDKEYELSKMFFPEKNIKSIFRFNEYSIKFENKNSSVELTQKYEQIKEYFLLLLK